jgi:hypothetical protein
MKNIYLFLFLAIFNNSKAQVMSIKQVAGTDGTALLQENFSKKDINTVIVSSTITINGLLKIPKEKTLKIEPGCLIKGKGTISGGIIDAGYQQCIFDTTLTVNPSGVNQYFSAKWFGAKGNNTDDYAAIQKSINTCISNNIKTLYLPSGNYKISQPLILRGKGAANNSAFCTLEIVGESSFWDSNTGSEIRPTFTNSFAIGIQRGKGCKIRKLSITGKFVPPNKSDLKKFFNTSFEDFTDGICRDNRYSPYAAIVIDPFTNIPNSAADTATFYPGLNAYYGSNGSSKQSGSTGTEIEEMSINNFVVGICSSPNGDTRNAEITIINKIQFSNCKLCISGGQDQEKDNSISNIYCWGGTHTIFATGLYGNNRMAGNWNIDKVNIAGGVVRFIYNDQHGYFASYVSHVYAEMLATWGTINSQLACEISDCNIDYAYQSVAGKQLLLTSWGKNVVYRSCNFRYYGKKDALWIEGDCTFDHCFFSGPIKNKKEGMLNIFSFPNKFNNFSFYKLLGLVLLIAVAIAFYLYKRKSQVKTFDTMAII